MIGFTVVLAALKLNAPVRTIDADRIVISKKIDHLKDASNPKVGNNFERPIIANKKINISKRGGILSFKYCMAQSQMSVNEHP